MLTKRDVNIFGLLLGLGIEGKLGLNPLKTKIIVVTDRQISQLFLQSIEMVDCD